MNRYMPEVIREQLFNFEKQILLYNIWDEKDQIMQNAMKIFSNENTKNQNYEKVIVRRLISHSATRVKEICKVNDLNEEIQERIWEALLYIYRSQIQLMNGRYVDQIIICSIYALKLIKSDLFKNKEIKFKGMISACESLVHFNSEKVKKTQNDNGEQLDIINFYNKIYLTPMKSYFKSTTDVSNFVNQTQNSIILSSSLKNSIPPNFYNYTPLLKEETQQKCMTPMTPMTYHLQAVENLESPYPINNGYKLKNKLIPKQLYQQQLLQQNVQSNNGHQSDMNQQIETDDRQLSKGINIFGQKYNQITENRNDVQENKQSYKLIEGDEKVSSQSSQTINIFRNIQSTLEGTPTLEFNESSPSGISPKFGSLNSQQSQNKKFLEDNNHNIQGQNHNIQRTIVRQNSIFGVRNPNFNSDDEDKPSQQINNS